MTYSPGSRPPGDRPPEPDDINDIDDSPTTPITPISATVTQTTAAVTAPPLATILYIEDDPASRKLVERTLRYAGYKVFTTERGLDGIDVARREKPDLILTDINLPDMTGREVTTMLRSDQRFAQTPIVALTAQTITEQRRLTLAAGVTGYMTKPIDIERLLDQVRFYLQGGHDAERDEMDSKTLSDARERYAQEVVTRLEGRIRELEAHNAELDRLDRMKDTFIQLTAHELRTPLTLVYGYNRLLDDNAQVKELTRYDPTVKLLIDGMGSAISRMHGIINEILTVSRIITHQIDVSINPTNLAEIIGRVIKSYGEALKSRSITLDWRPSEFPTHMQADWELLELTFSNLISNAIKYTPDGGTITLSARKQLGQVRVSIRDTGIGIQKEDLHVIFRRFHTTSDTQLHSTSKTAFRGGGIGLGLAVCQGVIEAHGGQIWAESPGFDPDKCPGSEFIVILPIIAKRPYPKSIPETGD